MIEIGGQFVRVQRVGAATFRRHAHFGRAGRRAFKVFFNCVHHFPAATERCAAVEDMMIFVSVVAVVVVVVVVVVAVVITVGSIGWRRRRQRRRCRRVGATQIVSQALGRGGRFSGRAATFRFAAADRIIAGHRRRRVGVHRRARHRVQQAEFAGFVFLLSFEFTLTTKKYKNKKTKSATS